MCKGNMSPLDACEECALKCLLIHKKKRDPSSIVSSFFKVMIDARFLEFLPIPPRFAPRLSSFAGQETRVEDASGRKWAVTLSSVNNSLGFERGWHAFSLDHGIELGDIVIVNYILDSHFVVQIFGRTGCEKLSLVSENSAIQNKRIKTSADPVGRAGPSNAIAKDSTTLFGSASTPSNMEMEHLIDVSTEELGLMMVNRDIPVAAENEPEISGIKPGDNVPKGNGFPSFEDRADNHHIALDAKMADTNENVNDEAVWTAKNGHKSTSGTRQCNGDSEANITQSQGANTVEAPEQLLDYDTNFEGDSLDVKIKEITPKGNHEFKCTSKMETEENKILSVNSTELPSGQATETPKTTDPSSRTFNAIQHFIEETRISAKPGAPTTTFGRQIEGNDGKSMAVERAPAIIGGSKSTSIASSNPGRLESEDSKERAQGAQSGARSELKPNIARVSSAGEVGRIVKAEPVSPNRPEVTCLVTPDSESFLELPKGLPFLEFSEKVVLLRDPGGRLWPVLYHGKYNIKALVYGWESFRKVNQIQSGDECVFALVDQSECVYRVEIIHKHIPDP